MSNTVEINTGIPVAALAGAAIAPVAIAGALAFGVIRALATDDPQCAELLRKSREALRRERWATIELRSADLGRLVRSAREARFSASPLAADRVRLTGAHEAPVWAARTPSGMRLVGNEAVLRELVTRHTASRAEEFLRSRGFDVEMARTLSGELRLLGKSGGPKAVKVAVGTAGETSVDPLGFKGPECETFVRDLSAAIEGTITSVRRKPEYWAAPGITLGQTHRA